MPIATPNELVDEFKKSGEFDRLRRDLLVKFQDSDDYEPLRAKIENVVHKRFDSDQKLKHASGDTIHRELMQEVDRYPIVERAVEEMRYLGDYRFKNGIRNSAQKILREDRKKKKAEPEPVESTPPDPPKESKDSEQMEDGLQKFFPSRTPPAAGGPASTGSADLGNSTPHSQVVMDEPSNSATHSESKTPSSPVD